ncbi:helix-turn-helix domain-containing protein [Dactylosporangium sp. NPDC051485]|uniref:ArsR/SmtB family transcription factor n=1 Tax=Dactylosporangium sp. NPDC051485 TaxID=3154846 RepID=UPI0034473BE8
MTRQPAAALGHPVRVALLELLRERGTVTSTEAARELGGSSGLHSFHLRQLARHGLVEPVPGHGREKPWRLAGERPADLGELARGLEDESYQRWLALREQAPAPWRRDEAFSQVVYVTPDEMAELAGEMRALVERYRHREARPAPGMRPVAVVSRVFPMLGPDA